MRNPKVGLLPLYVELYDRASPECRPVIEAHYANAVNKLRANGLDVLEVPICRLADEFSKAIAYFEAEDVDALVTLHLAYSPSLESEKALAGTKLPLIILDTTPTYTYDQYTDSSELMWNHGIHGVQDMCNLLLRNGKKFVVCAGHMDHSNVIEKLKNAVTGAMIATSMKKARVGLVGGAFDGMGDFQIPFAEMKRDLGIETVPFDWVRGEEIAATITQQDIEAEYVGDQERFVIDPALPRSIYDKAAKAGLVIRKWAEEEKLTAFSINFLGIDGVRGGLPTMPFSECCNAMTKGIGYAGEGDVLTAAFVGALMSAFKETTFTEMFCPDWEHGTVFMSHMGEYNYNIADGKPVLQEKPFPYTSAGNTMAAYKTMKGGRAVLLNLAPFGNGQFTLTLVPGQMLAITGENKHTGATNGWFQPDVALETLLETYSQNGGTHHSVLVYGDVLEQLKPVADFLGCKCVVINK